MTIFITGIAGTIGRAFTEILQDHTVIGLDRNEHNVAQFIKDFPGVEVKVGDFDEVDFEGQGIDVLIHLAAMKHVDLCETNANACVQNNVIKTYDLFKNAHKNFVNILFMSTDKAVEPISTYGYTKALGEAMALEYGGSIIRSGNVIEASGSVLQIWDEAIKNGQPIKITHKEMRRFFISPENLVKRAWSMYLAGTKIIVPKMDRDILLVELAQERIKSHGFKDYPIEFTGIRPGEKLSEKLRSGRE